MYRTSDIQKSYIDDTADRYPRRVEAYEKSQLKSCRRKVGIRLIEVLSTESVGDLQLENKLFID